MDDFSLGQSSARDLSVTIGVLVDKRNLLKPENGPLVRYEDIQKVDTLLEAIHNELERRGKLGDVTPTPDAAPVANGGAP